MPTYEYACRSCGSQLEVVQSFTDDPLTTCGECGGPLRKVFSAVGISFKGSGFYKTDSRSGSSSRSTSDSATTTKKKEEGGTSSPSTSSGDGGSSTSSSSSTSTPAASAPSSSS